MKEFRKELIENYKELASVFKMKNIIKVLRVLFYVLSMITVGVSICYTANCFDNKWVGFVSSIALFILALPFYATVENRLFRK